MKRKRLFLSLLTALLPLLAVHAQTAKALWCEGNKTLYFLSDGNTYTAGSSTYDGQAVTAVWSGTQVTATGTRSIPKWCTYGTSVKEMVFDSSFSSVRPTSCKYWFYQMSNLTSITGIENLNTSGVTNMSYMFSGCSSLTSLDLSSFSTSGVTDMSYMFSGCSSLTSLDLSDLNTSGVTNMYYMFYDCSSLTSLDLSSFNASNATNMGGMFYGCSGLISLDLSSFGTSNVTNMGYMFYGCSSLTSLDLLGFNASKVTNMSDMFNGCITLTSLDMSGFDTSSVTDMARMFYDCSSLTSLDVSGFDTSSVTNMSNMFNGCSGLTSLDVSGFDTSNVTSMTWMFMDCSSLTSLSFGKNFSMGTVSYMFQRCSSLRYLDFYDSDHADDFTAFKFSGVPKTTVIYLPHGCQKMTDEQNVVYSYGGDENDLRCPYYYSEDKVDIELPRSFQTNKAEYTRTMSATYGSVILPYDFTTNDDIQAYTLDEEHTETMYFVDATTIPAHTPFAFKKLGSAAFIMEDSNFGITVNATHTTSAAEGGTPYSTDTNLSGWTAKGYYINETVNDHDGTFYIASDKFYKAGGPLILYPHRVTFHGTWTKGTPAGAEAKFYAIGTLGSGLETAINAAEARRVARDFKAIYDVQGRRTGGLRKGINIVRTEDGKVMKVIKK